MKYNIGIFGTFDVENYGDVFFPVVFRKAMEARNLDFELFVFSPTVSEKYRLLGVDYDVYPVDELQNINHEHPLHAIVIGGGAIIQYSKIPVKLPDENVFYDYRILDSWVIPILFGLKNNIKILFNLPQVPYPFDPLLFNITKALLGQIEYLAVRDDISKKHILSMYGAGEDTVDVNVYPDSVCCIPQYIPLHELDTIRKDLLPFHTPYAVLHFNAQLPKKDIPNLVATIRYLISTGLKVVLLPLGYTHGDNLVLQSFNNENGKLCEIIEKKLNIYEMASILSGCQLYIGASFHGAITAVIYGKKAISYNYIHPYKNAEMFKMFGLDEYVLPSTEHMLSTVKKLLSQNQLETNVDLVIDQVNRHFDRIFEAITCNNRPALSALDCQAMLCDLLPDAMREFDLVHNLQEQLTDHFCKLDEKLEEKKKLRKELDKLQQEYQRLNQTTFQITQDYQILLQNYNSISSSFWWRATSPVRKFSSFVKEGIKKVPFLRLPYMSLVYVKNLGFSATVEATKAYWKRKMLKDLYYSNSDLRAQAKTVFPKQVTFSIVVPLYNTPKNFLIEMIDSVVQQTYSHWELCMADGSDKDHSYVEKIVKKYGKKDSRIKYIRLASNQGISENTNECIKMATGNYIGLFDHDDVLHPSVLFEYMKAICEKDADFIYCDEDKFQDLKGEFFDPHFKPDFAIDNLRANNYICHFTVFKKDLLEQVGLFRKNFDGSQDHDLILRLTEKAKNIVHVPKILYHWRVSKASVASDPYAKPYTITAGIRAVSEHLERCGLKGSVESTKVHPNIYRIKYEIMGQPLVSIIIPNNNHIKDLSTCLNSILEKTTYKNYEIIIVENNSDEETFEYYKTLEAYSNIKVVVYKPVGGFNYSAINNYGRLFANGEHLILLNNDVEVITPNWIEEMLMYSQREDVGAVGAMLYYPNNTVQHAGVMVGVLRVAAHMYRGLPRGNPGYFGRCAFQQNVSAVTAACLMLKSAVFDEVHGLDETFEVAFNDIDFCMRIRSKGYLNVWTPFAELYHHESISRGAEDTFEKQERFNGEVERFLTRWNKQLDQGDPYYNPNLSLEHDDFRPDPQKYSPK